MPTKRNLKSYLRSINKPTQNSKSYYYFLSMHFTFTSSLWLYRDNGVKYSTLTFCHWNYVTPRNYKSFGILLLKVIIINSREIDIISSNQTIQITLKRWRFYLLKRTRVTTLSGIPGMSTRIRDILPKSQENIRKIDEFLIMPGSYQEFSMMY